MNSTLLPQTLDELSVQLIFSDGAPPTSKGDLYVQIYVAALPPFVLGVPSQQVQLYLAQNYLDKADHVWMLARANANSLEEKECRVLPENYHEYFIDVYRRAALGHEGLPDCSLRFVSGHGYGTANMKDTHVKCGERAANLRFAHMGGCAKVLTVLDICANPHVTTCLADRVPSQVRQWKKKRAFDNLPFALACSKSSTTWCCRIGWDGQHGSQPQHPDYMPVEGDTKLSELLCFPVSNCILAAVKARCCNDDNRSLDDIFREKFQQLNTRYLKNEDDARDTAPPQTHSHLSRLQELMDNGVFPINQNAFDCILYQREREWFPTRELAIVLDFDDANGKKVAEGIVGFVIETIIAWYSVDPEERFWKKVLNDSLPDGGNWETYKSWHTLLQMMGYFRFWLLQSYFAIDDTTILPCGDDEGESNVDLKDLALCYPYLDNLVQRVQNWIETGNAVLDLESGDADSMLRHPVRVHLTLASW